MNKSIRILITILGGWFGLHKFIDKKIGMGILYLFTFGLFGIGWLFDIYKAFTSSDSLIQTKHIDIIVPGSVCINDKIYSLAYNYEHVTLYTIKQFHFDIPVGTSLGIQTEPTNEYDNKAIYFKCNNTNVGYIHKGRLQDMMHDYLKSSNKYITATFESIDSGNVVITLSFYKKNN